MKEATKQIENITNDATIIYEKSFFSKEFFNNVIHIA